jgi:hypothetical protein
MADKLSLAARSRLEEALEELRRDGVDIASLCTEILRLKLYPRVSPKAISNEYDRDDKKRISALPRKLREIAKSIGEHRFAELVSLAVMDVPSLAELRRYLSVRSCGLLPMRSGGRGTFLEKLPEILEDVARATEIALRRPPQLVTFDSQVAYVCECVKRQSKSKLVHYKEILCLIDPELRSPLTIEAIRSKAARERTRLRPARHRSRDRK